MPTIRKTRPRVRTWRLWGAGLVAMVCVGGIVALVWAIAGGSGSVGGGGLVSGAKALPDETLQDWVTYSDHVVIVTATGERQLPETAEERKAGEGLRIRMADLRVDEVLWSAEDAPPAPKSLSMPYGGWLFHGNTEEVMALEGAVSVDVGKSYVMAIVHDAFGTGEDTWDGLGTGAILVLDQGTVRDGTSAEVMRQLGGRTSEEVAVVMAGTSPDPVAMQFSDLPAVEQYQATVARTEPKGTPGPGES